MKNRRGFSTIELAIGGALLGGLSLLVAKNANTAKNMMNGVTRKAAFVKIESAFTESIAKQLEPNLLDSSQLGCGKGLSKDFIIPNLGKATMIRDVGPTIPGTEMAAAAARCLQMGTDTSPIKIPANQTDPGGISFCVKFESTNPSLPADHFFSSESAFAEVRVNLVNTQSSYDVFAGPFLSCLGYRMNFAAGISLYYRAYWKPKGSTDSYQSIDGRALYPRSGNGGGENWYNLIAKHSNKCAGIENASLPNGALVVQSACKGISHQEQLFRLITVGDAYEIVDIKSGRCLDVEGAKTANATIVQHWDCNKTTNQLWKMFEVSPGSNWFQLKPVHTLPSPLPSPSVTSGKCLDVMGGNTGTQDGAQLIIYDCLGETSQNQLFKLTPPDPYLPSGFFFYNNTRYNTDGSGNYCSFDTQGQWYSYGGPASGAPTYTTLPNSMTYTGRCLSWAQLYVLYLYEKLLHRTPAVGEMAGWVGIVNMDDKNSRAMLVRQIAGSTEYSSRYPDNTAFVTALYYDLLGRAPDSGGLSSWLYQLNTGQMNRYGVVGGFVDSNEFILRGGMYDPMYGVPQGAFKDGLGAILYSNGQMACCGFTSWERWKANGGSDDTSLLPIFKPIPSMMTWAGPCN